MTMELKFRMTMTETDMDYLASRFIRLPGMVIYHNMLRDMSTACGMQLICVRERDLKPAGEPRCKRCMRAVDAILPLHLAPLLETV